MVSVKGFTSNTRMTEENPTMLGQAANVKIDRPNNTQNALLTFTHEWKLMRSIFRGPCNFANNSSRHCEFFLPRPPHKHIGTSRGIVKATADVPVMDSKTGTGRPALQSPRRNSPFPAVQSPDLAAITAEVACFDDLARHNSFVVVDTESMSRESSSAFCKAHINQILTK
jgi:hypothetical protein